MEGAPASGSRGSTRGLSRAWALLLATAAWLWLRSSFTPWAMDREPRLWLYDGVFYLGFGLLAWWLAEAARIVLHLGAAGAHRRALPLVLAALAFTADLATQTGAGWSLRTHWSRQALELAADGGYDDVRRRAGVFIVENVREPCPGQAWLWLGRPHDGGNGIGQALVRSGTQAPLSPTGDAFAFVAVGNGWWTAYQDGTRYHQRTALPALAAGTPCVRGHVLPSHRAGRAFLAKGRSRAIDPAVVP